MTDLALPVSDEVVEAVAERAAEILRRERRFLSKKALAEQFGVEERTIKTWRSQGNAELRERVEAADREQANARALAAEANASLQQLERAHARQKAAEEGASAAQRRRREAERDARELCAANEELHRQLKKAYDHAAELEDLNERVKRAQGVADLIGVRP